MDHQPEGVGVNIVAFLVTLAAVGVSQVIGIHPLVVIFGPLCLVFVLFMAYGLLIIKPLVFFGLLLAAYFLFA